MPRLRKPGLKTGNADILRQPGKPIFCLRHFIQNIACLIHQCKRLAERFAGHAKPINDKDKADLTVAECKIVNWTKRGISACFLVLYHFRTKIPRDDLCHRNLLSESLKVSGTR